MNITHDTTIEEYEAWLATNPSFNSFKAAVRRTYVFIYRTLSRIGRLVKRVERHSACTSGKLAVTTVYPFCYDKNGKFTTKVHARWLRTIRYELARTQMYLNALDFDESLHDEIAMEGLKLEALEIIHNR
jgi:hypothetical protein